MFDVDDVVTLDNGEEYYLIDKNVIAGEKYFYAVKNKGNIDELLDSEYCFFRVEDDEYLVVVKDEVIIEMLVKLFIDKVKVN